MVSVIVTITARVIMTSRLDTCLHLVNVVFGIRIGRPDISLYRGIVQNCALMFRLERDLSKDKQKPVH
ncbi:hypothetical protein DFO67_12030 [Modicisalibacter xianhensis]|uniref:Uncharacterized protein n=1 Tax=Modicisalibacter xianhensis TaxID=442341 RepID=A0A4R8FM00_9GAMM|nr:hypothetical protein DFO67_12030 [Halomonas xianhensis]